MPAKPDGSVYDETYHFYLERLQNKDFSGTQATAGIRRDGGDVVVEWFGKPLRLNAGGLEDEAGRRPDFADCVVICRYLLMAPAYEPTQTDWVAFRDFSDAGPLTVFWADTVEGVLAKAFAGRVGDLKAAASTLGGVDGEMDVACDLCCRFTPLPKIPLLLVFHDADEDFPASVSILWERRAATYLDAESQGILGHLLTNRLIAAASE